VAREAKAAQPRACKLLIERILSPAREQPTPFPMVEIGGLQDMPADYAVALTAANLDEMSLSEAEKIGHLLDGMARAFEVANLAQKIEQMRAEIAALRTERAGPHVNGVRPWQD
jgi:hypothetical protein